MALEIMEAIFKKKILSQDYIALNNSELLNFL